MDSIAEPNEDTVLGTYVLYNWTKGPAEEEYRRWIVNQMVSYII